MADIEAVNKKLYGTVMETNILSSTPKKGRDEKRAAIVKIAYEAFLTDGYAATSMSSIAAKVGGSKATLYNYFASKEELFAAVIE
jgi:AcrR family transcriptional regulator